MRINILTKLRNKRNVFILHSRNNGNSFGTNIYCILNMKKNYFQLFNKENLYQ